MTMNLGGSARSLYHMSLRAAAVLLSMVICFTASGNTGGTRAYFAGFAVAGNYADSQQEFPHTLALLAEKDSRGVPLLEAELARRVAGRTVAGVDLVLNELGNYKTGDGLALAFVVDWENVSIEKVAGNSKIVVDLHAQILTFDYATMKVLGSFPVAVQVRDATDGDAEARVHAIVREIYFGTGATNVFDRFVERLDSVTIKPSYGNHIRVTSVTFEDKARETMAQAGTSDSAMASFAARSFGKFLSTNQKVAILPFAKDQAIGGKIAARFANGDIYNLTVPEADYAIRLVIRGFKKVAAEKNRTETAWLFGSFIHLTIEQPELSHLYLDSAFKFAAVKHVPVSVQEMDDWAAYQESLLSLFDQLTAQISKPHSAWLKKWAAGPQVGRDFAAVAAVLDKCR